MAPFPLSAAWRKAGAVMAAMEPDRMRAVKVFIGWMMQNPALSVKKEARAPRCLLRLFPRLSRLFCFDGLCTSGPGTPGGPFPWEKRFRQYPAP